MGEEGEARQPGAGAPGAPGGPGAGEDFAGAAGAVQQRDVLAMGKPKDLKDLKNSLVDMI